MGVWLLREVPLEMSLRGEVLTAGKLEIPVNPLPGPREGPLIESLWPLIVGVWGILERSCGVKVDPQYRINI